MVDLEYIIVKGSSYKYLVECLRDLINVFEEECVDCCISNKFQRRLEKAKKRLKQFEV